MDHADETQAIRNGGWQAWPYGALARALLYYGLSARLPGRRFLGQRYLTIENFPIDKRELRVFTVRIENRHIH
jgi:hypothetical protein